MKRISITGLLVAGVFAAVISTGISFALLHNGSNPPAQHPLVGIIEFLGALALLWTGRGVKRLKEGKPTTMTPLGALRVAVAAQSGATVGALLGGWSLGLLFVGLSRIEASYLFSVVWAAAAVLVGAIFLLVVGLVVESWCALDQKDDDEAAGAGTTPPMAPA